jgi:hypothetical protein
MSESRVVVSVGDADLIRLTQIITDGDEKAALEFLKKVFQPEIDRLGRG